MVAGEGAGFVRVEEFKRTINKSKEIIRSESLPSKFLKIAEIHGFESCKTYGSLNFMWLALKSDEQNEKYINFFNDLISEGLNISIFHFIK